ncbi:hypothetical protein [Paludisphaera borealis]|uniref:Uncharacterized protein n=1 Tax=Paludisphaera borealis TaxID=1387353 RepID=A0A1U7CM05_9BACT|nr:hypothetical protein [Paludisphaera borealis]APW59938.1 hypothetical protein BSF38_01399 [Paludisphaera borealis]
MSLHDFWTNVRMGARLIAPQGFVDAPRLDADDFTRRLRSATLWLTPRAVDGFEEEDFPFLPEAERARLTKLVNDFRKVARTVNPTVPVPTAVVENALPLFRDIVLMLEFDRFEDDEAYRLGKMIEQEIEPYRPRELADLRFRTGEDHTGDPGLWIWAFLSDDASKTDEEFLKTAQKLRELLDPVARRIAPDRWPYLSFRSLAEQSEPVEAS